MKKLKKVGFYKEQPHGDENGDSLINSINNGVYINLSKVLGYLEHGHLLMVAPAVLTDLLSEEQKYIGTLTILTDGAWAWPGDLVYYIQHYGLSLPEDFLHHMENRDWNVVDVDINDLIL